MRNIKKQIFGLSDSASLFIKPCSEPVYFRLLASLPNQRPPEIIYIGAARGDDPKRIADFYQLSHRIGCRPRVLNFFDMVTNNPSEYFAGADIVYIDGGSSKNLLAILAAWDAVTALKAAYENGVIIAGASPGLSILSDWLITDSVKTAIMPLQGLGFIKGTACVHHNARSDRRDVFDAFLGGKEASFPGFAIDDGVAVHFVNGNLERAYKLSENVGLRIVSENFEMVPPPPITMLSESVHAPTGA